MQGNSAGLRGTQLLQSQPGAPAIAELGIIIINLPYN
jgi:hypothetical protein